MRYPPKHIPGAQAFTLIELLTVVSIIAVLCALLFPAVGAVRASADSAKCVSNLRQIGTAFRYYSQNNDGLYPAPRGGWVGTDPNPLGYSWQLELATYTTAPLPANNLYRLKEIPPERNAQYCPGYVRLFPSITALRDNGLNALGYGMNINLNVGGKDINFGGRINERFKEMAIVNPVGAILVGESGDYHLDCSSGWRKITPSKSYPEGYASGAPERHHGKGNYLFADNHVEALKPEEALPLLVFRN